VESLRLCGLALLQARRCVQASEIFRKAEVLGFLLDFLLVLNVVGSQEFLLQVAPATEQTVRLIPYSLLRFRFQSFAHRSLHLAVSSDGAVGVARGGSPHPTQPAS
jgi:hypothetical protein